MPGRSIRTHGGLDAGLLQWHEDELADPWRRSAEFNTYGLLLDATELAELAERLDAAIRPYLAAVRSDPPADARPVHLFLHVKVKENWAEDRGLYQDVGLDFDV